MIQESGPKKISFPNLPQEIERRKDNEIMLWTIVTILLILWFYGLISGFAGNLIHILLVIVVAVLVFYIASRSLA
jgi:fatty acid desaturase